MFLFDCWLASWPFISNPGCWTVDRSCSCLIVGWFVDHMSWTVRGCYMRGAGSSGLMDTIRTGDASVLMMRIRRQELSGAVNGCIVLERDTGGTRSGALSIASVLYVLDGWLETKPSLFVYLYHVGMVG
ncbi:hypothetical protein F2Q69_00021333 [Brassica cretica]|uniref:Uncharacterized protein n=1 Tax=Brassica cretica TaxID=69181 RepID=A0A8S9QAI4_BRACR|nr:hypothetical protein F2Q69_00021333 [Brassica cretica]